MTPGEAALPRAAGAAAAITIGLLLVAGGCSGPRRQPVTGAGEGEVCGDGQRNGSEACDGADVGGATCSALVEPGWAGSPGCTPSCTLDTATCAPPASSWHPLRESGSWAAFDVSTLNGDARGFRGGAFDGTYVYLVPANNGSPDGLVVSFDTRMALDAAGAWAAFDVSTVNADAKGFSGAAFDGRFLYLAPNSNAPGVLDGIVARCDTHVGFGSTQAWSTFDVATLTPGAKGFSGAAFDGRYVYLIPGNDVAPSGLVARYDTRADFGAANAWTIFDVSTLNAGARGFWGAVFDGRYLYLVPANNGAPDGVVARFDTQGAFASPGSWEAFDVATVNAGATGFAGGAFDGRYVYLVPSTNDAPHGLVVRYDPSMALSAPQAWAAFDLTTIDAGAKGFAGATFDGRYLYLAPFDAGNGPSGRVARLDTQGDFNANASWTVFDVATLNGGAQGFAGALFDGSHVYLVPANDGMADGLVVRFLAKSPAWLPRLWNASFF